jgi:hypothetical protein
MMRLPARRERVRSGILRAPKREWPAHRRFIRRHVCVATLGIVHDDCDGPIVCAHVRLGASENGGSIKPHDAFTVSLCDKHHKEQHGGEATFSRKYGLNMLRLAKDFAMLSTVEEVREFAKTMPEDDSDIVARADRSVRGQAHGR